MPILALVAIASWLLSFGSGAKACSALVPSALALRPLAAMSTMATAAALAGYLGRNLGRARSLIALSCAGVMLIRDRGPRMTIVRKANAATETGGRNIRWFRTL